MNTDLVITSQKKERYLERFSLLKLVNPIGFILVRLVAWRTYRVSKS